MYNREYGKRAVELCVKYDKYVREKNKLLVENKSSVRILIFIVSLIRITALVQISSCGAA
jgi:hypothetical protein